MSKTIDILYKGTDGEFFISQFTDKEKTQKVNLDNYLDVIVHVFTTGSTVVKFSINEKEGYTPLIKIDEYEYKGILEGAVNSNMRGGFVYINIFFASTSSEITTGRFKKAIQSIIYDLKDISTKTEA